MEKDRVSKVFSPPLRIFGETLRAQSQTSAVQEVKRKFSMYNMLLGGEITAYKNLEEMERLAGRED